MAFAASLRLVATRASPFQSLQSLRLNRVARVSPSAVRHRAMASSTPKLDTSTPDEKWKELLTPKEYFVLRQKGTEAPGTGEYDKTFTKGVVYKCRACSSVLYTAEQKFDSGCGWPAFYDNVAGTVERHADPDGRRIEITCKNCGGHLGHVFKGEGFPTPTNERHCVNSISIKMEQA